MKQCEGCWGSSNIKSGCLILTRGFKDLLNLCPCKDCVVKAMCSESCTDFLFVEDQAFRSV